MIVVIDNQMGNIKSVSNALKLLNAEHSIASTPEGIERADKLILPGVGNFRQASQKLDGSNLTDAIRIFAKSNKPVLGICLGMQLLFETSEEDGPCDGLSLIPGKVCALNNRIKTLPIPHVGWNDLVVKDSKLMAGINDGDCVYFVHSYEVLTSEKYVIATTDYSQNIVAAVQNKNIYGVQFHPEKSQKEGIQILKNFVELC